MRGKKGFILAALLFTMASLAGCSGSLDSGEDQTADSFRQNLADAGYAGADRCVGCHEDFSWSYDIVAKYLSSAHVIHSDHINAASGAVCLQCHDPIGDSVLLEDLISEDDVPDDGLAAVTCEACHGSGASHYGIGPIPVDPGEAEIMDPRPGPAACGQCHDDQWETIAEAAGHLTYHPEGNAIYSDYLDSPHNNIHDGRPCSKCHTDEGAHLYRDYDTVESLSSVMEVENPSTIQCRTCHDPHMPGSLLEAEQTSGRGSSLRVVASAEYATCTNCHQRHDAQIVVDNVTGEIVISSLPGSTSTDGSSGDLIYHAARYGRVISSTHYDNPDTPGVVEGYIVKADDERACRDCHNVHSADITINEQWAESGHGGEILEAKNQYVIDNGGVLDNGEVDDHAIENVSLFRAGGTLAADSAFVHYDWDAGDRQGCQMCHSATGFKNYVTDPENYDPANNDFSHLAGWEVADNGTVTASGQNELLFCWACHSNNAGALRVQGAVTAVYTYNDQPVVFPDVGSSNTCVVCHSGRGNNEEASTSSRFAGHHAPAAADLFSDYSHVAYEYPGLSYANVSYFAHPGIDIDGSGPCVACHMNAPAANHTFSVVEKDAAGVVIGINADVCVTCHDGEHALFVSQGLVGETVNIWNGTAAVPTVVTQQMADDAAAVIEEEAEGYQEAGELLNDHLNRTNGLTNYTGATINQNNTLENDRGAFQNAKLPGDEPGGFAHNRYYVKRAIFDAIDWVENGAINGTITIPAGYPEARSWFGADAGGVANRP